MACSPGASEGPGGPLLLSLLGLFLSVLVFFNTALALSLPFVLYSNENLSLAALSGLIHCYYYLTCVSLVSRGGGKKAFSDSLINLHPWGW